MGCKLIAASTRARRASYLISLFDQQTMELAALIDGNRITAVDYDEDGWVDLYVASDSTAAIHSMPEPDYRPLPVADVVYDAGPSYMDRYRQENDDVPVLRTSTMTHVVWAPPRWLDRALPGRLHPAC